MPKPHQKKTDMYKVRKQEKIQDLFNLASPRVVPTINFEWGVLSMEKCPKHHGPQPQTHELHHGKTEA